MFAGGKNVRRQRLDLGYGFGERERCWERQSRAGHSTSMLFLLLVAETHTICNWFQ